MMSYPEYPNPDYTHQHVAGDNLDLPDFDLSDYLLLGDDGCEEDQRTSSVKTTVSAEIVAGSCGGIVHYHDEAKNDSDMRYKINCGKKNKTGTSGLRVAFRTKSELLVMDDGFKWRKYGKKSVKSSPNPRNYYRCSSGGCCVKKRVERDRDDANFVITTYEGVHNHASPGAVFYDYKLDKPMAYAVPAAWNSQSSSSSHSSHSSRT